MTDHSHKSLTPENAASALEQEIGSEGSTASQTYTNGLSNRAAPLSDRVQALRLSKSLPANEPGGRNWLPWTICALLAISALFLGARGFTRTSVSATTGERTKNEGDFVQGGASNPTPSPLALSGDVALESKGYIIAAHQLKISSKVVGVIEKLFIIEGQKVKEGEVLAILEKTNWEAAVERAKATLEAAKHRWEELENGSRPEEKRSAQAALEEAKAQLEEARSDFKRSQDLRSKIALSPSDYEKSQSAFKTAERRVARLQEDYDLMVKGPRLEKIQAANAEMLQAQADLKTAQWNLDNCTIKAPISGTILKKEVEIGQILSPAAGSTNVANNLCEMADLSDLEVELSIVERDIAQVFVGQSCKVRAEAYPDRVYDGTVSRLMPIADRSKSAIKVRVKLTVPEKEEGAYLKPEMGAIVSFMKKESNKLNNK